jgi:hypothetical protein
MKFVDDSKEAVRAYLGVLVGVKVGFIVCLLRVGSGDLLVGV